MATKQRQLGKEFRLWIAQSDTPADDTAFDKIVNENALQVTWSADVQENSTKEEGAINNAGDEKWEIKFDFNDIYEDTGFASLLANAKNTSWIYQVRMGTKVWLEGEFILSQLEYNAESKDVRSGSGTLVKSGTVKEHAPFIPVGTAVGRPFYAPSGG